jgi:hypothetical protein
MQYELADPSTISASVFDDEIVVANFSTGIYYSLRFSAAEIWLGLMAGVAAEQVIQAIAPHCTGTAQGFANEASSLIRTLESEQLIKSVDRKVDETWAPRPMYRPYEAPCLESFTDMEDLLLLDPIHDVGKTGWPDLLRKKPA